jgi:hypothetical protein
MKAAVPAVVPVRAPRDLQQLASDLEGAHCDLVIVKMGLSGLNKLQYDHCGSDEFVALLEFTARAAADIIDDVEGIDKDLRHLAAAAK